MRDSNLPKMTLAALLEPFPMEWESNIGKTWGQINEFLTQASKTAARHEIICAR